MAKIEGMGVRWVRAQHIILVGRYVVKMPSHLAAEDELTANLAWQQQIGRCMSGGSRLVVGRRVTDHATSNRVHMGTVMVKLCIRVQHPTISSHAVVRSQQMLAVAHSLLTLLNPCTHHPPSPCLFPTCPFTHPLSHTH